MANIHRTGFRSLKLISGGDVPVMTFNIAAASAVAMFIGDLVSQVNTGTVTPSTAADGCKVVGVVVGIRDTNGVAIGSPGSSVSTKYLPVSTAGFADVALALPDALFVANSGSATLALTDVFDSCDHVATAGSTVTGISGHVLNAASLSTDQCTIVGLYDVPNNTWGTYVDVVVRFSESMWYCNALSVAS